MPEKRSAAKILKVNIANLELRYPFIARPNKCLSLRAPDISCMGVEGRTGFPECRLLNSSPGDVPVEVYPKVMRITLLSHIHGLLQYRPASAIPKGAVLKMIIVFLLFLSVF
jgi:hypothetical protein